MEEILIEISNLRKSFGRRRVLTGANLQADGGEIIGIVGENGVGKSTLLKTIVGILSPDGGSIEIRGSIGYCPQDMVLFENLTVDEHFRMFAAAYGLTGKDEDTQWREVQSNLQKMMHYEDYNSVLVSKLSGGTKQKLNFSLSVLHEPDILILDEPYSALDWESYRSFWNYTEKMKAMSKTVILVSHMIFDRAQIDRLFELKDGELRCVRRA